MHISMWKSNHNLWYKFFNVHLFLYAICKRLLLFFRICNRNFVQWFLIACHHCSSVNTDSRIPGQNTFGIHRTPTESDHKEFYRRHILLELSRLHRAQRQFEEASVSTRVQVSLLLTPLGDNSSTWGPARGFVALGAKADLRRKLGAFLWPSPWTEKTQGERLAG